MGSSPLGNSIEACGCLSRNLASQLATHCWGKAPFESGDSSKNNAWVAALTFGEGWHNNHHAFPNSAKQGLFRGQIDITWEHIKILAKFGLAKKVKLPSRSYY